MFIDDIIIILLYFVILQRTKMARRTGHYLVCKRLVGLILYTFVRLIFRGIQILWWKYNGTEEKLKQASLSQNYDRCVQVLKIVWWNKFDLAMTSSPSEFLCVHDRFESPKYIFDNDHVSLFMISKKYAIFSQAKGEGYAALEDQVRLFHPWEPRPLQQSPLVCSNRAVPSDGGRVGRSKRRSSRSSSTRPDADPLCWLRWPKRLANWWAYLRTKSDDGVGDALQTWRRHRGHAQTGEGRCEMDLPTIPTEWRSKVTSSSWSRQPYAPFRSWGTSSRRVTCSFMYRDVIKVAQSLFRTAQRVSIAAHLLLAVEARSSTDGDLRRTAWASTGGTTGSNAGTIWHWAFSIGSPLRSITWRCGIVEWTWPGSGTKTSWEIRCIHPDRFSNIADCRKVSPRSLSREWRTIRSVTRSCRRRIWVNTEIQNSLRSRENFITNSWSNMDSLQSAWRTWSTERLPTKANEGCTSWVSNSYIYLYTLCHIITPKQSVSRLRLWVTRRNWSKQKQTIFVTSFLDRKPENSSPNTRSGFIRLFVLQYKLALYCFRTLCSIKCPRYTTPLVCWAYQWSSGPYV